MIMKNTFYHTTNPTCVTIIYPRNKTVQIGFPSTFPDIVFQETKEYRTTQIESNTNSKESNEQQENTTEE